MSVTNEQVEQVKDLFAELGGISTRRINGSRPWALSDFHFFFPKIS